jgi:hypothetical protein
MMHYETVMFALNTFFFTAKHLSDRIVLANCLQRTACVLARQLVLRNALVNHSYGAHCALSMADHQ